MQEAWQVGQCGNQGAQAEVMCRRRREVRAIAARAHYHSVDKPVNINIVPLNICREGPPQAYAEI
jgi:hypothetical protein